MKIAWEYDLVEKPFCEQLRLMGWEWLEGDTDVPELTERANFREVLLRDRLRAALHRVNLGLDGQPWLDDERIDRAIRDLEQLGAHRLIEANQEASRRLIQGATTAGRPEWERGRPQPLRFIDFDNWERNDFLVINQFKVELASGRGHIIPDVVLW
jgi:type I restriction enzyme R subunit